MLRFTYRMAFDVENKSLTTSLRTSNMTSETKLGMMIGIKTRMPSGMTLAVT